MRSIEFDGMVLDVMMPGESGLDLATDLRNRHDLPILMLTARGETEDRIAGLERGVDDYLAKPFEPRELMLRLNAMLRRVHLADNRRRTAKSAWETACSTPSAEN